MSFEQAASAEDAYAPAYYPGGTTPETAAPVEVAAGSTVRGIDIRLQKMHAVRVRGRVLDGPTNNPAGGVIVMLTPRAEGALKTAGQKISRASGQGLFELNGVTPGLYMLTAHTNSNQPVSARMPVEVGQSDIDNLTLTLTPGGEIPGVVKMEGGTGDVPKGLVIQLDPTSDDADFPSTPAKNDGSFRLQHVQAEIYAIRIHGLPDTIYVKGVRFGEADAPDSGLDFSHGFTPGERLITLAPTAAHVDGTVLDDRGQPFAGATVVIAPEKGRPLVVATKPSGGFTAGGLAPGNYRVWAFDEIENGAWDDPEYIKPYESNAERVTLKDNDRQTVRLKLIVAADERRCVS